MSKVFVEYAVKPDYTAAYKDQVRALRRLFPNMDVLEGTDQPGLFVEIWHDCGAEWLSEMTAQLRSGNGPVWGERANWVKGGAEGVRMWRFHEV